MKGCMAVMAMATLSACAYFPKQMPVSPNWTTWRCDSQVDLQWRYAAADKTSMEVRLGGSDTLYTLTPQAGAEGELFSDGVLALHKKGDEGLVYWVATDDLIGRGCKAP